MALWQSHVCLLHQLTTLSFVHVRKEGRRSKTRERDEGEGEGEEEIKKKEERGEKIYHPRFEAPPRMKLSIGLEGINF